MKTKLLKVLTLLLVLIIPKMHFGQAPDLGTVSTFAVFTAIGAVSNDGATIVVGDLGTNAGAYTGFPPGVVYGNVHIADAVSAQAATDVIAAYNYLSGISCGPDPGATLGNGQILTADVYCTVGAATLDGDLILDGEGDPNALFIIKINGAFATSALSNVILINSATLCNVYWHVNGAVALGAGSVFQGTIISSAAVSLAADAALMGRGLSTVGAIAMASNNIINTGLIHNVTSGEYFCTLADAVADPQTLDGHFIEIPFGVYTEPCVIINKSLTITAIGGLVTLDCIIMNGVNKNLILGSDLTINSLTLTNGMIHTDGHNLRVGVISGGSVMSYVVTD